MTHPEGLRSPEKLSAHHDLSRFGSGEAVLDEWLRRRALQNEASGASRTYVVCVEKRVVGYYTLAGGAVALGNAHGRVRRGYLALAAAESDRWQVVDAAQPAEHVQHLINAQVGLWLEERWTPPPSSRS